MRFPGAFIFNDLPSSKMAVHPCSAHRPLKNTIFQWPAKRRRQGGLALPLVLWVITLLSIMAGGFALLMKNEIREMRNIQDSVRAEAVADAAINYTLLYLTGLPAASNPLLADEFVKLDLFGTPVIMRVTPATGLVDLNKARRVLLARLFAAVGVDSEQVETLIDRIADWRDKDDAHRANGAEKSEYEDADKFPPPKNANFDNVVELHQVLGVTNALYEKLAPYLTTDGGGALDPSYAPRRLLELLSEDGGEDVQAARGAEAFSAWSPRLGGGIIARAGSRAYRLELLIPDRQGRVRAYLIARVRTGAVSNFDKFAHGGSRIIGKREGIAPSDIVEYARSVMREQSQSAEETDGS